MIGDQTGLYDIYDQLKKAAFDSDTQMSSLLLRRKMPGPGSIDTAGFAVINYTSARDIAHAPEIARKR